MDTFNSLGVIEQGVVSADETVNVFWDGTIDGAKLPDGTYTIQVSVGDGDPAPEANEVLRATAILDSSAPRVSGVLANGDNGYADYRWQFYQGTTPFNCSNRGR